jgi:hypothetical protein
MSEEFLAGRVSILPPPFVETTGPVSPARFVRALTSRNAKRKERTNMRFMCIYRPADTRKAEAGHPPDQDEVARMGQLIGDMIKAGVLLATDGLLPSSKGARVRLSQGKFTVTDGPFTEAKELIAGFAIIRVNSKDEAVEWVRRFLQVAGDGESEIRLMWDTPAFPPEPAAA